MERAETTARLLDVGYRMSLFPNPRGYNNEWESVLAASGAIESYKKKYNDIVQKHVEHDVATTDIWPSGHANVKNNNNKHYKW